MNFTPDLIRMQRNLCAAGIVLFSLAAPAGAQTSTGLADVRINGDVRAIQPMGDGTVVIGGEVRYYNDVLVTELLRLQSNGTRAPFPVTVGGQVHQLLLDSGWLYIGGDFQVVNNVSVPFVARVNATTGAVDATWRPAPNGDLTDMAVAPGGLVIAGAFTKIGGLPRSRVALVGTAGPTPGRALEFWRCDADQQVDAVAVAGGKVYLGGRFKKLNSTVIQYLARVDAATGTVEPAWNPTPQFHVFDLAADATHLYCAGSFSFIGNGGAPFLSRVVLTTGSADQAWTPFPDSLVTNLTLSGDSVYAAGIWNVIGGVTQPWIARVVKSSGAVDPAWKPPINGGVRALAADGSGGVWAGGRFSSGGTGAGAARFNLAQGTAAPAYPGKIETLGVVSDIMPEPSGGWLIGGNFDTVNGVRRPAIFRLSSGRAFDPGWSAGLGGYYPKVNAMDLDATAAGGPEVVIAGQFEIKPAATLLFNCLRLKTATGVVQQGFTPQPRGQVNAMIRQGSQWVIGGDFDKLGVSGSIVAPRLARFDAAGTIDAGWKPQPNASVHSLLVEGADLYAGGEFTTFGKSPNVYPAKYLTRIAVLEPDAAWQPQPDQAVFALASDGSHLYAGGRFTRLARGKRKYLAQLPLGGAGTPTAWNPNPNGEVHALHVSASHLYAGGLHSTIAGFAWPKLARFHRAGLALDTAFQSTGETYGLVDVIAPQADGSVWVGGSMYGWDDDFTRRSLIRIVETGASPLPPAPLYAPPADDATELLEAYFAPASGTYESAATPGIVAGGAGLTWMENAPLPPGLVARVQWSHDLHQWHESGDTAGGLTHTIIIEAHGQRRTARVFTDGDLDDERPPPLLLRVAITPGETPALLQP